MLIIYLVVCLLTQLSNMLLYIHKVDNAHASKGNLFQLVRKDTGKQHQKGWTMIPACIFMNCSEREKQQMLQPKVLTVIYKIEMLISVSLN